MHQYKKPPIVEAIIELRLSDNLSLETKELLNKKLGKRYASSTPQQSMGIKLDVEKQHADFNKKGLIFTLQSEDQLDRMVVQERSAVWSRLAPYICWDNICKRAKDDWSLWRKSAGYNKIERIGIRYINRIDIPIEEGTNIDIEDYLNVTPKYPEPNVISSFTHYTMQVKGRLKDTGLSIAISSSTVPSPLVNYISVLLDIDIGCSDNVPQKEDDIWALIDKIRAHKNQAFEDCITEKARELFDQ